MLKPKRSKVKPWSEFLDGIREKREHEERVRDAIEQHRTVTIPFLERAYHVPRHEAQRILKQLIASGRYEPNEKARLIREGKRRAKERRRQIGKILRKSNAVVESQRTRQNAMLELMIDFGFERKILTMQEIADAYRRSVKIVEEDIAALKASPSIRRNPDLRELIDLTILKSAIISNPRIRYEELKKLLGINRDVLLRRFNRLRELDLETLKKRIVVAASERSIGERETQNAIVEQFSRGEISKQDALQKTGLTGKEFDNRVYRIRKRLGVPAVSPEIKRIRDAVRAFAEGKISRADALKITGLPLRTLSGRANSVKEGLKKAAEKKGS